MTEIGNTVSGPQVTNLRSADTEKNKTGSIDRFAPASRAETDASVTQQVQERQNAEAQQAEESQKDPLERAAEAIEEFIPQDQRLPNTRLRINQDEASGQFVYQNVDNESGEVVRQFPSEEILEFLSYYRDLEGIVVDDEA